MYQAPIFSGMGGRIPLRVLRLLSSDSSRQLSEGAEWLSNLPGSQSGECGASVHTPSTGTGGGRALDETEDRLSPTVKEWQRQALRRGGSRNGVARLLGGPS